MTDPPDNVDSDDAPEEKPPETEASSIDGPSKYWFTKGGEHLEGEGFAFVESANLDLRENVAPPVLNGSVWEVVVIREGVSLNNRYYSRPVLEASLSIWEKAEVRVYGYTPGDKSRHLDHVPPAVEEAFPQGAYANRAGFLRNVRGRVNEADGRYEVVAEFAVTDIALRAEMLETHNLGGDLPGFSIHAYSRTKPTHGIHEGRRCLVVPDIAAVYELTIVSKPAAGGRALRLVAAESTSTEENQMNLQRIRDFVAARQPKAMAGLVKAMEAAPLMEAAAELLESESPLVKFALTLLQAGKTEEAAQALEMALDGADKPADEPAPEMPPELVASATTESAAYNEVKALREQVEIDRCERTLEKRLSEAALGEIASAQLRREFAGRRFNEADLAKAIADKRELLAVNAGGRVVVESAAPRNPHISVMLESSDKTQIGLNLMMGIDPEELLKSEQINESEYRLYKDIQRHPNLIRPRRLYQEMSGDWGMRMNARVSEAITTSTYSAALGTSINLMLAQAQRTRMNPGWDNIIAQEDKDNLLDDSNIILGGYDILPDVSEGANYTDLGNPKEYGVTQSIGKKGGYVSITEEAIINDRIGAFQHMRDSARDAGFNSLDRLAWSLIPGAAGGTVNGDTSFDGVVHYHASHFNTATSAFSQAALGVSHTQLSNTRKIAFVTALNDGDDINSSDTAVVVDDASGIQVGAYISIDAEIMRVTAVSTNTLTVVRAQQGTTAASHSNDAVVTCYGGQLELGQSVAMGWGPEFYIIAPNELRSAVYEVLGSQYVAGSSNFNANYFQGMYQDGLVKPIFVPSARLGGDTNNWYTAVPWQLSPMLKIVYFNGQRAPQVVDETPLSGDNFLADKMKFRVKFRFGGKAIGHVGRTGNIVSGG